MKLIEPYKSIGQLMLNMPPPEIEAILGEPVMIYKDIDNVQTRKYSDGTSVDYSNNLASFIGVLISVYPVYKDFSFWGKSYFDVAAYFKLYPGNIYKEDDTMLISEHLGITTYFEDGLKEVGIFSGAYSLEGLSILK